jgi:plasmid stabilization system protein ParE
VAELTVVARGIDFSMGIPDLAALADIDFIVRYVAPGRSVSITAAEVAHWRAAGKELVAVWERGATRARDGFDAGAHDMREAIDYIVAIGGPADASVYLCADDWGATGPDMPVIAEYIAGGVSVRGHDATGAYGGLRTVRYLADHDACALFWQTYAWSGAAQARSGDIVEDGTAWDPRAQLL